MAIAAPQRASVRLQGERLGGAAVQIGLALRHAGVDRPVRVDVVVDGELVAQVADFVVAVARLAEEARGRDRAQLVVDRDHAAVQRRALARGLHLVVDDGVGTGFPREARRDQVALAGHGIAEAAVVLVHQVQPVGQRGRQGAGGVQRLARGAIAAGRHADGVGALELRLLGGVADDAARVAAPVQRGGRSLEHLHALQAGGVARHAVAAVPREAVEQVVGAGPVAVAGEAAHGVVVPQAAEAVLARDAGYPVVQVVAAAGGHRPHQFGVDAADRKGNLHQVGIGARGHRRFPGPIACRLPLAGRRGRRQIHFLRRNFADVRQPHERDRETGRPSAVVLDHRPVPHCL